MKFIKNFFKTIFIILIILFFSALLYYQYQKMEKSGAIDKIVEFFKKDSSSNSSNIQDGTSNGDYSYNYNGNGNSLNNNSNSDNNGSAENSKNNSDKKFTLINTSKEGKSLIKNNNYDEYYNKFNFDNFFLLYEGNQNSYATNQVLERLIVNIDDPLYSKPMVNFKNFGGLTSTNIGPADLDEYRQVLYEAKNSLDSGSFTISFGYNKIRTIINTIIIQKN